jgi:hypothetical protein
MLQGEFFRYQGLLQNPIGFEAASSYNCRDMKPRGTYNFLSAEVFGTDKG